MLYVSSCNAEKDEYKVVDTDDGSEETVSLQELKSYAATLGLNSIRGVSNEGVSVYTEYLSFAGKFAMLSGVDAVGKSKFKDLIGGNFFKMLNVAFANTGLRFDLPIGGSGYSGEEAATKIYISDNSYGLDQPIICCSICCMWWFALGDIFQITVARGHKQHSVTGYGTLKLDTPYWTFRRKRNNSLSIEDDLVKCFCDACFALRARAKYIRSLVEKLEAKTNLADRPQDFKPLTANKLQELAQSYPTCSISWGRLTNFAQGKRTLDYMRDMKASFLVHLGFRRYFIDNGQLYLWFGEDEVDSGYC